MLDAHQLKNSPKLVHSTEVKQVKPSHKCPMKKQAEIGKRIEPKERLGDEALHFCSIQWTTISPIWDGYQSPFVVWEDF